MFVIQKPIHLILILFLILIGLLLLFKLGNFLENLGFNSKPKKEEPKKASSSATDNKVAKVDEKLETVKKTVEISESQTPTTNYLYDRFVTNPTVDDEVQQKGNIPNYITQESADEIKNAKVKIDVTPIKEPLTLESYTMHKVLENNVKSLEQKEKLLAEFDSMPKSMKLLLIENIMKGID